MLSTTLARSLVVLLPPPCLRRAGLATMSWAKEVDRSGVTFVNSFADPRGMPVRTLLLLFCRRRLRKSAGRLRKSARRADDQRRRMIGHGSWDEEIVPAAMKG